MLLLIETNIAGLHIEEDEIRVDGVDFGLTTYRTEWWQVVRFLQWDSFVITDSVSVTPTHRLLWQIPVKQVGIHDGGP